MHRLTTISGWLFTPLGLTLIGCVADVSAHQNVELDSQPYDAEEVDSALAQGLVQKRDSGGGSSWHCSNRPDVDVTVECNATFDYCRGEQNVMVRCTGEWPDY